MRPKPSVSRKKARNAPHPPNPAQSQGNMTTARGEMEAKPRAAGDGTGSPLILAQY